MHSKGIGSLLLVSLIGCTSSAAIITEEFSNVSQKDTSTAIWNIGLSEIHPTVKVDNYQVLSGDTPTAVTFDVGDGSHGDFNSSTYANFGSVVGLLITIDASVFPILKFSNFNLEAGYTLTSVNGPLIIYSQSDVVVDGVIQCSGANGSPALGTTGGAGGAGRCGGNTGGAGGNLAASGMAGAPATGSVRGGGGGTYTGAAPGAGGGGAGTFSGNAGGTGQSSTPATNAGGVAGAAVANHDFTILTSTPSGGGGSGSDTEGGGGGGGGGGTVIIHAVGNVTITAAGQILARGGNGGSANTGGGGGGGGGGSVKIFTVGNLTLTSGIEVDVNGGTGTVPTLANAGDGAAGSFGRTWIVSTTFSGTGSESQFSNLWSIGVSNFSTAAEAIVSKSYDTQSDTTQYQSILTNPISSEIAVEVAGSTDNFVTNDSGWLPGSQINLLNTKRYVKFKITLTNTSPTVPTKIFSIAINLNSGLSVVDSTLQQDFNFKGCGLIRVSSGSSAGVSSLFAALGLLLLPLLLARRLKLIHTQKKI